MLAKFHANVYVTPFSYRQKHFHKGKTATPLFGIKKRGRRLLFPQPNQLQKHFFQKLRNLFCVLPINK